MTNLKNKVSVDDDDMIVDELRELRRQKWSDFFSRIETMQINKSEDFSPLENNNDNPVTSKPNNKRIIPTRVNVNIKRFRRTHRKNKREGFNWGLLYKKLSHQNEKSGKWNEEMSNLNSSDKRDTKKNDDDQYNNACEIDNESPLKSSITEKLNYSKHCFEIGGEITNNEYQHSEVKSTKNNTESKYEQNIKETDNQLNSPKNSNNSQKSSTINSTHKRKVTGEMITRKRKNKCKTFYIYNDDITNEDKHTKFDGIPISWEEETSNLNSFDKSDSKKNYEYNNACDIESPLKTSSTEELNYSKNSLNICGEKTYNKYQHSEVKSTKNKTESEYEQNIKKTDNRFKSPKNSNNFQKSTTINSSNKRKATGELKTRKKKMKYKRIYFYSDDITEEDKRTKFGDNLIPISWEDFMNDNYS